MKKRIISLVIAMLLMFSITVCASADSAVNEARKGVAKIIQLVYVDGELDLTLCSSGSGFFVGKEESSVQYIVTNHHVVADYLNFGEGEVIRAKNQYGTPINLQVQLNVCFDSENAVEAYVLDYDETQDIAVLKLEETTTERIGLPLRIPTDSMVGDTMYVVGYPGTNEGILNTTSEWGVEDSIVAKGTVGRLITESGTGDKWIGSSDIDIHHGNSGGPILDENGAVIGVACQKFVDAVEAETMSFSVNSESVIEMLRRNEVPFEMADEAVEEPAPTEKPEQPAATPVPAPVEEESGLSPVIIAAVAVAVIAVVAAVVLASKNKKSKQPVVQQNEVIQKTVPADPVKKFSPVVRSLAPQHNKQKVAIKANPIIVGRAKECDIIFKEGTPGVSGKHCAVTWDEEHNVFVLKDMNSTYGTFLDSGMKLDPNRVYRIKAGDSFYLGDKENMLRVELD